MGSLAHKDATQRCSSHRQSPDGDTSEPLETSPPPSKNPQRVLWGYQAHQSLRDSPRGQVSPFQIRNLRLREQQQLAQGQTMVCRRDDLGLRYFWLSEFSEAESQVPTKALSAHTFGEKGVQMAKKLGKMVSINVIEKQIKTRANIK